MTAVIAFLAKHALVLALTFLAAAGAGTLAAGEKHGVALRSALGLALWAHALFALSMIGALRPVPILVLAFLAIVGGALRGQILPRIEWSVATAISTAMLAAVFLSALRPPLAFDETLYHMPFVRALASSGTMQFLPDLRFAAFPRLHELLCVPVFLLAGDTATHLVSLLEAAIAVALLVDWSPRRGLLAAALFAGSPIVVQLATINYTDTALTLFVLAGFLCLARRSPRLAALFLGTACGVKYLGGFFVVAALVILVVRTRREGRRDAIAFAGCALAAALPTTLWIAVTTGNPVFPFVTRIFGDTIWALPHAEVPLATRVARTLRLPWNVTFARDHVNQQPPVTPFLIPALVAMLAAARRDGSARAVACMVAVYAIAFAFLPQDSRYLVPLLPLIALVAAAAVDTRWPARTGWLAAIAIAPGLLYATYMLAARGLPPATPQARERMIARSVPEYAALTHAQTGRVYVCGGEELRDLYTRGRLLGDLTGAYSFGRIIPRRDRTSIVAKSLERIDARYYLVAKRACRAPRADGGMTLVYDDAHAQLWRVDESPRTR